MIYNDKNSIAYIYKAIEPEFFTKSTAAIAQMNAEVFYRRFC